MRSLVGSALGRGTSGLILAILIVVAVLVGVPSARWFLLLSAGLGVIIAVVLHFWNKSRPVKIKQEEDKRPLKLDI